MCLYVSYHRHPDYKPRIAGYDMLVWKQGFILPDGFMPRFRRLTRYTLGKRASASMRRDYITVGAGLHAYIKRKSDLAELVCLPAIIPKGARFYFGNNGDIVANQLTVYRNLRDALQGRTLGKANARRHKVAKR